MFVISRFVEKVLVVIMIYKGHCGWQSASVRVSHSMRAWDMIANVLHTCTTALAASAMIAFMTAVETAWQ